MIETFPCFCHKGLEQVCVVLDAADVLKLYRSTRVTFSLQRDRHSVPLI